MKKRGLKRLFRALPVLAVIALFGCTNDIDSASTSEGVDNSADDSMTLPANDGKSDKDSRKELGGSGSGNSGESGGDGTVKDFGDGFIRGFDASAVDYFENVYAPAHSDWNIVTKCSDSDGSKDIFALLADHGFNTIRLRVWVDPTVTETITNDPVWPTSTDVENAWKNGDNTKERAATLAKRAKAAGMKVLLDFHLSDYWTDPSVQLIPKSWQSVTSADEMKEKLTSHITEVLQYMKDNSVTPDYVQVGNEIDRGILVDKSVNAGTSPKTATAADSSISGANNTENFKTYLKAGCAAVRDFDSDIKIIIHITAKNSDRFSYVKSSGADYDIIGLSYYSWENHGTIDEFVTKIQNLKSTHNKDVMVVETSFAVKDYTDKEHPTIYSGHMTQAATNLSAKNYSDVTIESDAVVPSEDVQKAILRHTMQEVYDAGGIGICIWGGERRDYQYGLFDWDGKAYKAIDAFNYKPSDGDTAENASDDETEGKTDSDEEITLTLTFSGFALTGGTGTITYSSSEHSGSETATLTIAENGGSATAKLKKSVADSYQYYNGISVSLTDSNETAYTTFKLSNDYFQYSDENTGTLTLTCTEGVAEKTMTLKLSFGENSRANSVSVKYWSSTETSEPTDSSKYDTKTGTVSGNSVSLTLSDKYAASWVNGSITIYDSSNKDITSNFSVETSGVGDCSKFWFEFSENTTKDISLKESDETGGGTDWKSITSSQEFKATNDFEEVLSSTKLSESEYSSMSALKIEFMDCDWSAITTGTDIWYFINAYCKNEWNDSYKKAINSSQSTYTECSVEISDWTDFITNIKANGLYINATKGMTGKISISYR